MQQIITGAGIGAGFALLVGFGVRMPQSHPTFLVDGRVAGTWRVVDGAVQCEPFHRLPASVGRQLAEEGERLAAFYA